MWKLGGQLHASHGEKEILAEVHKLRDINQCRCVEENWGVARRQMANAVR